MYSVPRQIFRGHARAAAWCLASAALVTTAGCGNNYRPVVSAINPVGPSAQPTIYGVALSDPGNGNSGLITVFDVFGDTILANASVAAVPTYLGVDNLGQSYVIHSGSSLIDSFTAAPGLMTSTVRQSSLVAGANPNQINPGSGNAPVFITEPTLGRVAVLTAGAPPLIRQELPVPANPVYTIASANSTRSYTLSQGATPGTSTGTATAIENGLNNVISASIPVGISPVYGVMSTDGRRAFVVNQGTGTSNSTVTVINTQGNVLDTTVNVGIKPVWADVAPAINELAVLNGGNGTSAGSLSVINIALCSVATIAGNAQCDTNNPSDSVDFGKILATVPVGIAPVQVAVLTNQNKAYVANSGDGTVTVVDLTTMVATSTIRVGGKLNWIAAVAGSPTGKVYVTASNTQVLTIIRTDNDTVTTTLPLQGNAVSVRIVQ